MKYALLAFVIFILSAVAYKYIFAGEDPIAFTNALNAQKNPFLAPKDSSDVVWNRAKEFLEERKRLISGGDLRENDSLLLIPYSNSYEKGSSVRIERHVIQDSVLFHVQYWYSRNIQENGAKEIALFMEKKINKYDY